MKPERVQFPDNALNATVVFATQEEAKIWAGKLRSQQAEEAQSKGGATIVQESTAAVTVYFK